MPVKKWSDMMNEASKVEGTGGGGFAKLKAGESYNFVIKAEPQLAKTGDGSKDKITINPSVESGECANARVFHDFVISDNSPAAMKVFFSQMEAIGLGADFFQSEPTNEQIAQHLHGKRFVAEAYEDTYNNKTKIKIRGFAPAIGPAPAGQGAPSQNPLTPPQGVPTHQPNGTPQQGSQPQGWGNQQGQAQGQSGWGAPAPQQPAQPQAFGQGQGGDPNQGWGQAQPQAQEPSPWDNPQGAQQNNMTAPWGQPQGGQAQPQQGGQNFNNQPPSPPPVN